MTTPSAAFDEPPPYPGPSSAFSLPPYETAAALDYWDDTYCLPPYQSRTGQRFHPYARILPVHRGYIPRQEKSFEEFYRSLQRSASCRAATSSAVAEAPSSTAPPVPAQARTEYQVPPPVVEPPAAPGLPPPPPAAQNPDERRHRLIRHLFLLPEFLRIVRAGLAAAMRAAEARF